MQTVVPSPQQGWRSDDRHLVRFYEADEVLLAELEEAFAATLTRGDVQIVVATEAHRASLEAALNARGIDLPALTAEGRYVALDADATLDRLRVGEPGDEARFDEVVSALVSEASSSGRAVYAYGEMVALLVAAVRPAAAVRLELLWNEILERTGLHLSCAYPLDAFFDDRDEDMDAVFREVCLSHSSVTPAETYDEGAPPAERRLQVAMLQRRASMALRALDAQSRAEALLHRALVAERTARAAAERALAQRDDFLNAAAHELRTPLTGILGHVQLLVRRGLLGGGSEQLQRGIDHVRDQAERMRALIDQMLDARVIETDELEMQRRPTDLLALLADVIASTPDARKQYAVTLPGRA